MKPALAERIESSFSLLALLGSVLGLDLLVLCDLEKEVALWLPNVPDDERESIDFPRKLTSIHYHKHSLDDILFAKVFDEPHCSG